MSDIALVTGAAGFIGSHLCEALLAQGRRVRGLDWISPFEDPEAKHENLSAVLGDASFELVDLDLRHGDLSGALDGVSTVFHFAAQTGVPESWAQNFDEYASCNILATQRLLEAVRRTDVDRFVNASSGSVYGNLPVPLVTEDAVPRPHSPYGATKLAAEHLCSMYAVNWGVPVVSLRFFYVYGPRQRSDVAVYTMIDRGLSGTPFELYGSGRQVRDFVYVADVVDATLRAATSELPPGTFVNVSSGVGVPLTTVVDEVARILGAPMETNAAEDLPGYVHGAPGDNTRARELLGWQPATSLSDGLEHQVEWQRRRHVGGLAVVQ